MPDKNDDLPSLEALSEKIRRAQPKAPDAHSTRDASDYSQAFRFTVDLTAGVLVGCLIGYGIDAWLGTVPLATIICLFIGMGAGIRNMMRSAKEMESKERE